MIKSKLKSQVVCCPDIFYNYGTIHHKKNIQDSKRKRIDSTKDKGKACG